MNRKKNRIHGRFWVNLIIGISWVASLSGCSSAKRLVYFQSVANTGREDTIKIAESYVPTIKKGDVLSVSVSSLNAEASNYFNPPSLADAGSPLGASNPLTRTPGYLVNADGTIKLPLVGQVAVEGLTNSKASELIRSKLEAYLKEPTVNVRNLNFRISVLGEVARPSLFSIPNEQITLPEALGLAGDLTIYARRDNILVIREENNKRVFARLDLTRRDVFTSPFYSLHPNDVIYAEPGKARAISVDRTYQLAPILIGALSLIAIIVTRP